MVDFRPASLKTVFCILYQNAVCVVGKREFSPGKPDLCSDQTTPFGRSKGGGTYRYRGSFSISHDHCAGYFGRSPIRVSTKSVAENCLARQGWPVKAGTVETP